MEHVSKNSLLLRGAQIIGLDRIVEQGSVLIKSGRIVEVFDSGTSHLPAYDAVELDLDGLTLFPGFIDVHIHGAVGVDTMEASAGQLAEVSRFLATRGVTGWLPTLVPASQESYTQAVSAVEQQIVDQGKNVQTGARVLGVHYEGPFVNHAQCGALHMEHFRTYADEFELDSLAVLADQGAKMMMTLAPEIAGGIDLVRALTARGWVLSLGHTRATLEVLNEAFEAGARHMTHFMNAMPQLHHRSPGPVAWGLLRDDVSCDFIADGIHLDPLILKLLLKVKGARGLNLISDAIAAAGLGDGDYQIWGETISVKDGRTSNAAGSIAGAVITMLEGVRMMLSLGVSEVEVAWMASTNPARLLGIAAECGSIQEGKRADLVALDLNGNVRLTIVGGSVVFQA